MNQRWRALSSLFVAGLLAIACRQPASPTAVPPTVTAPAVAVPGAAATPTGAASPVAAASPAAIASGPIRIGATGPFSGQLAGLGQDFLNAVKLAVDERNGRGGLFGRKIELVEGDDAADPQKAATVAQKFAADASLVAVVGPLTNGAADAALPIYEKNNLGMITPSATSPRLAEPGYRVFHRVIPSDADQGPASASFMVNELQVKAVAAIDDRSVYSTGLVEQVEAGLKRLDPSVRVTRYSVAPEEKDFSQVLTRVKEDNPDLLFVPLSSPDQIVALAAREEQMGLNLRQMGADGLFDRDITILEADGTTEGMYVSYLGPNVNRLASAAGFVTNFKAKFNAAPGGFAAQGYEATNLILTAIEQAGVKEGKIDRPAVNQAISATRTDQGILGIPISFTPNGDLAGGPVFIFQVKGNDFEQVKVVRARE